MTDNNRIRDNQRRSRARRKEYLQELEAKVRRYEKQGVEAAAEIQAAARKVKTENVALTAEVERLKTGIRKLEEENRRLGRMLVSKEPGSSSGNINQPSGSAQPPLLASAVQWNSYPSDDATISGCIGPSGAPLSPSCTATASDPCAHLGGDAGLDDPVKSVSHQRTPMLQATEPQSSLQQVSLERLNTGSDQDLHKACNEHSQSPDRSLCIHAAQIVASMRHDFTAEELRVELGCKRGEDVGKCKVDNRRVFGLVDRLSG